MSDKTSKFTNMGIAVQKATCLLLSNDVYNYLFLSHLAQHAHGERLKLLPLQHFNKPVSSEKKNTILLSRKRCRYFIYCAGLSAVRVYIFSYHAFGIYISFVYNLIAVTTTVKALSACLKIV